MSHLCCGRTYHEECLRCDRYDIDQDRYYEKDRVIPTFMKYIGMISPISVAVNATESYALLITDNYQIVFTEDNGFECNGYATKLPTPRPFSSWVAFFNI